MNKDPTWLEAAAKVIVVYPLVSVHGALLFGMCTCDF